MGEPIRIARGIVVPAGALESRAVRSSGPGGQNVNKVASKVELRVRPESISGLDAPTRARLAAQAAAKLDADGRLLVTSQRTRDQLRNLEDARAKVQKIVERALRVPRPRRLTAPSPAAIERRLRTKRVRTASSVRASPGWTRTLRRSRLDLRASGVASHCARER
jgi:ribosome-associated protein